MIDLDAFFKDYPFGKDVRFEKRDLPRLPSEFKPTIFGEPRVGMLGQYRRGLLHAYEFQNHWEIHKDEYNPETHPVEHLVHDAPHWLAAAGAIVVGGLLAAAVSHFLGGDEDFEDYEDS